MDILELRYSKYLKDNCIRFRCSITIFPPATVEESHATPTIFDDLKRLLESGNGCDVTFEVDGKKFGAHKSIMAARSPVFNALFFGSLSDPNLKCVTLPEMDPDVFKGFLDFVYCDELSGETSVSMYESLFVAADKYDFSRLKAHCEDELHENIGVETVASILLRAEMTNSSVLKSACLEYITCSENIEEVMETDSFRGIVENHSQILAELMKEIVVRNKNVS
ncbi:hypothetical protein M569_11145 [Genlisea aurea]|uniref:BTB domain-containing protein n=1 Tax=Genlisea aurea TaxID=192259 RepID=S8CA02_9LAMI|nr:hypothetical protein M569_11145 [Genlisea aurea]